jgi:hypothetical protein
MPADESKIPFHIKEHFKTVFFYKTSEHEDIFTLIYTGMENFISVGNGLTEIEKGIRCLLKSQIFQFI